MYVYILSLRILSGFAYGKQCIYFCLYFYLSVTMDILCHAERWVHRYAGLITPVFFVGHGLFSDVIVLIRRNLSGPVRIYEQWRRETIIPAAPSPIITQQHTHAHTHPITNILTHTHTYTHTYIHTQTHSQSHTQTQTHTHRHRHTTRHSSERRKSALSLSDDYPSFLP